MFGQMALDNRERLYFDYRPILSEKRVKVRRVMVVPVHNEPHAVDDRNRWHIDPYGTVSVRIQHQPRRLLRQFIHREGLFARNRTTELCTIDITRKNCTIVDDRRRKLFDRQVFCVRQIGATQDCPSQERALKVRVPKGSIRGIRAGQVRAAERYAAEISPADESPMNIERPLRRPDLVFQHHDSPSLSLRSFMISCTSMGGASSP
jgi:hypothetical protein